jgi:hypothetical protein
MRNAGHWWRWFFRYTAVFSLPVAVSVEFLTAQEFSDSALDRVERIAFLVLMPSSALDSDSPHLA